MNDPMVVRVEQRGRLIELRPGVDERELDEGPMLITFHADIRPLVELDDQLLAISWRSHEQVAACNFDLTNQVGYHRLRVTLDKQEFNFDFHTSTAKATRDEVLAMAEVCGRYYFSFRHQFVYLAANGEKRKVLLPQVHFAWLRDRITEIDKLTRSINLRPAVSSFKKVVPSMRAKGMSLPRTIRLIHEKPHLLEERGDGPIPVENKRYWPAQVIARVSSSAPALHEHIVIARFLKNLIAGCGELLVQLDAGAQVELDEIKSAINNILALPIYLESRSKPVDARVSAALPTQIERSDVRYARIRALRTEYISDIGPSTNYEQSIRANVKDISEIYQTFVAHVVGNALGLDYISENQNLRARDTHGASMRSKHWIFGFDIKPPGGILRSWRESTARPAGERPDISLVAPTLERSIIFDAKFKNAKNPAKAAQQDLFEMQGYLNSFSIPQGGIIYPGTTPVASQIEAGKNRLVELPIRASFFDSLGGKEGVHDYVRKAIDCAIQPHKV